MELLEAGPPRAGMYVGTVGGRYGWGRLVASEWLMVGECQKS